VQKQLTKSADSVIIWILLPLLLTYFSCTLPDRSFQLLWLRQMSWGGFIRFIRPGKVCLKENLLKEVSSTRLLVAAVTCYSEKNVLKGTPSFCWLSSLALVLPASFSFVSNQNKYCFIGKWIAGASFQKNFLKQFHKILVN